MRYGLNRRTNQAMMSFPRFQRQTLINTGGYCKAQGVMWKRRVSDGAGLSTSKKPASTFPSTLEEYDFETLKRGCKPANTVTNMQWAVKNFRKWQEAQLIPGK